MLLSIKTFLQEKQSANLQELTLHFCKPPEAMRCLLSHWIRKGKVCRLAKPAGCGTKCQLCQPPLAEIYQWVENTERLGADGQFA